MLAPKKRRVRPHSAPADSDDSGNSYVPQDGSEQSADYDGGEQFADYDGSEQSADEEPVAPVQELELEGA